MDLKQIPGLFLEKVRIKCEGDMRACLWVTDLKETGFIKIQGPGGQTVYRERNPHKVGSSVPVRADGKYSTYEVLFRVTTTSTNTEWHDEGTGGTLDTTFSTPLKVTAVRTNLSGTYHRGDDIPLADLGRFKILVSAE